MSKSKLKTKTLNDESKKAIEETALAIREETRLVVQETGLAIREETGLALREIPKAGMSKGAKIGLTIAGLVAGATLISNQGKRQRKEKKSMQVHQQYDMNAMNAAQQISSFSYNRPYRP